MGTNTGINSKEAELFLGSKALLIDYQWALESANRSPKTIVEYLANLKRLFAFLSSKNKIKAITDVGRSELRDYIQYLQKSKRWSGRTELGDMGPLSPASIQVHVRTIKAFWGWLLREEYIERNPFEKFPLPKVPLKVMSTLAPVQINQLISPLDKSTPLGFRNYTIVLMLFDGGFRISELINIKISDVDMNTGMVTVVGKGGKQRLVPVSRRTIREVSRYLSKFREQMCPQDALHLFAKGDGSPISANGVFQLLKRLKQKAGLGDVRCSPHVFRHTCATEFVANGGNVFALKAILGHASLSTTLKYTHLRPADIRKEHSKFSPVNNLF
jgi:site-specific recombinase XerD